MSLKNFILLLIILISEIGFCQNISFTSTEVEKLKILFAEDTSAGRIFLEARKRADKALKDKPSPMETISTAGRLKGDSIRERTIKSTRDFEKILNLSLCYTFTGKTEYLNKAIEYLKAWANVNKATGEPINETKLDPLLEGYDLIRNTINQEDKKLIDEWLRSVANKEIKMERARLYNFNNNFQSHRIKIVGLIGFILDEERFKKYAENGLQDQIENNLNSDGSSFDFKERDALHYHCYTLDPLLRTAILFKKIGKSYFNYTSPKNTSLKKSVDFLLPYISGKKMHLEYVNSKVEFDKKRSENGQENYKTGKKFDIKEGINTVELAEYFDSSYLPYIMDYYRNYGNFPTLQILINKGEAGYIKSLK